MPKDKEKTSRPSKVILNTFYDLPSFEQGNRKRSTLQLINGLSKEETAVQYCLERLVKGLASPRQNARLGFSVALNELLKSNADITCNEIFNLMDKHLPMKGAGDETKNNTIGHLLCLLALIRSGKCHQTIEKTMERLNSAITDRPYFDLIWAQAVIALSEAADEESFRNVIFPSLKSTINIGLDKCSATILWLLLELDKVHQKFLRKKAKLFRDGNWPPVDEKSYAKIGEILATGVKSTPSGMHPLSKSLLIAMIAGDSFEAFWNHTVAGYLLTNEDKLVSSSGIRMIGDTLQMTPSKKQVKCVLSVETLKQLLKAMLDRRPAAHFSRSAAWNQIEAIQTYVVSNKANPDVQFLILKNIIDFSINFDSVSGTNLVSGVIGSLSNEALSMAAEELMSKLKKQQSKNDKKLQPSEMLMAMKLLYRVFECSRFSVSEAPGYRSKIMQLLTTATFMKSEFTHLPPILSAATNSELMVNIFMRCLDQLCIVLTAHHGNKPKFEFPKESALLIGEIMQMLFEKKQAKLSEKCRNSLKPEHEKLAVKASMVYHQLLKLVKSTEETELDNDGMKNKGFAILVGYTLFWFISDTSEYSRALEDILQCYEKSQDTSEMDTEPSWMDVLMDTLLELLSRPHRYIRTSLQVAFHYFCPLLRLDNIQPLLKALKPSEAASVLMEDDNESENNDEASNENDGENEADTWTPSDEESEADGEEEEEEENTSGGEDATVDPEFRRAIEDALGDAAAHSDTESVVSDLNDEAMLKLDNALAAVFRAHLTGAAAKKSARDLAEQAQAFRLRCFDLVFVLLHSKPSAEVVTGILLPLLHVANEAVRINEQKNVFNRARQVLERITQMRQLPSIPDDSLNVFLSTISQLIEDVVEFTRKDCSNPSVQLLASEIIRFLLKFADSVTNGEKFSSFESQIKGLFAKNLEQYLKDRSCLTPTCIFVAAFQKRPRLFLENLPVLVESAFSDDIRPFRRREACSLIHYLLNKDALSIVKDESDKKITSAWKRFIERLHSGTVNLISKQDVENTKKSSDSVQSNKLTDLFEILSVIRAVANLNDMVSIKNLQQSSFFEKLEKLSTSPKSKTKLFKISQGRKKMKLSSLCSEILKKLRPSVENAKLEDDVPEKMNGVMENEEGSPSPPPTKRKKTKG